MEKNYWLLSVLGLIILILLCILFFVPAKKSQQPETCRGDSERFRRICGARRGLREAQARNKKWRYHFGYGRGKYLQFIKTVNG